MPAPPDTGFSRQSDAGQQEAYEPGQLVIHWDDPREAHAALAILANDYAVLPVSLVDLKNLGGVLATLQMPSQDAAVKLMTTLRKKYPSWRIDLHTRYRPLGTPRIYLPGKVDAPSHLFVLPSVRIGMLDSPVGAIKALRGTTLNQRSFLGNGDAPASPEHGTAVAALIAGREQAAGFQGFSSGVQLYAGGIMRQQGGGDGATNVTFLLRGLDWLLGEKVRVINLSLGGPDNEIMANAFAKLLKKDVIIVAAAGNSGPEAPPSFPAAYRDVVAVSAIDALDRPYVKSNRGQYVTLAAPGVDVWTPDADNGHYVTGTSFSAAVVTSAIGLMLSSRPGLTPDQVRDHLCRGARDHGTPGRDPVYGCGVLQIARTLANLKSASAAATK